MYCRKCGKQIDYDAPICKECEAQEEYSKKTTVNQDVDLFFGDEHVKAHSIPNKEGFGGALAATIMGSIAFVISLIVMSVATVLLEEYAYYGYGYSADTSGIIVFSVLCLGLAVPSLINGIKSIRCFKNAKKENKAKPVATLVCGIVGMVTSAITFLYVFLTFIMCALI